MSPSKNVLTGLLMVCFGFTVLLLLIPFGVIEPKKVQYAALSPSHYPRLIAIVLTFLGAAVAIRALVTERGSTPPASDQRKDASRRLLLTFILLGLYAILLEPLGFIIASALALGCLLWLAGERRSWLIIGLAFIVPFCLYIFFVEIARIPIPAGIMKPLLAWL